MKRCPTCQEEFSDKFKFCPVDSSPLSGEVAVPADDSVTVNAAARENVAQAGNGAGAPTTETTRAFTSAAGYGADGNGSNGDGAGAGSFASDAGASGAGSSNYERDEYHLTFLQDEGLTRRLLREIAEVGREAELSWPEFKRNPVGFVKRGASAYGKAVANTVAQPNVAKGIIAAFAGMLIIAGVVMAFDSMQTRQAVSMKAMILVFSGVVFSGAVFALLNRMKAKHTTAVVGIVASLVLVLSAIIGIVVADNLRARRNNQLLVREDLELQNFIPTEDVPKTQPTPDKGPAGMAKGSGGGSKPQFDKPHGGGGGGREETKPASFGKLPPASMDIPQVVAPDPHPPKITNPHLPTPATIVADPVLFPPDPRNLPYGDPKSKSTDPSSGPGTGNGIGTGTGGGVGSGEGGGVGPGRGGNTGGGDVHYGGGGPGGGGGGDYDRVFNPKEVTRRAQILDRPEPLYTEEARKNQITGTVRVKMVLNANGSVSGVAAVTRLPDGLTEKAIEAAHRIKFVPAEKDGHKVSQYVTIDYNFNIY